MPKPKYILKTVEPKPPKREPYVRCEKTVLAKKEPRPLTIEEQIKMYQIQKKRRTQEERRSILNG